MSDKSEWSVSEATKITIPPSVERVRVRIVGGTVNIVGSDSVDEVTVEVAEVEGEPLKVSVADGTLTVTHADLPWQGLLKLLDRKGWQQYAEITLAVPSSSQLKVGVVSANAVISGVSGRTELRGISGDSTLVGLSGEVRADIVSGNVDAQGLTGELRFNSVSGGLTVVDSAGRVRADSVSGELVLDVPHVKSDSDLQLSTVSGAISARLPEKPDLDVEAVSTSGRLNCAFEQLAPSNKQVAGTLGDGGGRIRARSVSGTVALLRRPKEDTQAGSTTRPSKDL